MEKPKNIILVDDHVLVRNGLKELIEKLGPFRISDQFDSGEKFLQDIPHRPEPDLIVLDLNMPGMNGDEVMEKLNARGYKTPVLVLTVNDVSDKVIKLFRLGARGYLMKNCRAPELKNALEEIFRTGYYHNDFFTHSLRTNIQLAGEEETTIPKLLASLSSREREFLKLVCDERDYTYTQIGDIMGVQHSTVDGYRHSVFNKTGIRSKTGLVVYVLRHKLLDIL